MAISRVIGCISAKGGVGKTTSAINLSAALHHFGKSVTLVDANLTTPNIGIYLGVPIPPLTIHDALRGKKEGREVLYNHKSGIKLIPGSISLKDAKRADPHRLGHVLRDLDGHSDFIVVDGAPGLGKESQAVMRNVNEFIVVTNPEMPGVTDALKTVKLCKEHRKDVLGVLVTKTNVKNADMSLKVIQEILEIPVLGVIPEDRAVKYALANKEAVVHSYPKSASSVQYKKLAADLLSIKYNERIEVSDSGFLDGVLRWLGIKD